MAIMDLPDRILLAIAIIAGATLIVVPLMVRHLRRRRREKLRRRGIKTYGH